MESCVQEFLQRSPLDARWAALLAEELEQPYFAALCRAHGLAFSVRPGVPLPRSLRNIYKEREADLGLPPAQTGCLIPWARAGVLLINTVLTVDAGQANSHAKFGWQTFTDAVFRILWQLPQPVAFVLWGKQAQIKLERAIDAPAKRGFFGSRPFSQVDAFLRENGAVPIGWAL